MCEDCSLDPYKTKKATKEREIEKTLKKNEETQKPRRNSLGLAEQVASLDDLHYRRLPPSGCRAAGAVAEAGWLGSTGSAGSGSYGEEAPG